MAKIDLDSLSIEELAALRDNATDKLAEKVAARQAELEAELEQLSLYGKPSKRAPLASVAKPKKSVSSPDGSMKDASPSAAASKDGVTTERTADAQVAKDHNAKAA